MRSKSNEFQQPASDILRSVALGGATLDSLEDPRPPAFSDDALAKAFTDRHGEELRYVAAWGKWLRWSGARWQDDSTLSVYDSARAVCRDTAAHTKDERLRRATTSAKTVAAVERLAQSDRVHAAEVEQWDRDDFLLNTPAGTVDLRTSVLRPHRRSDYLTKLTGVAPDFERDGEVWKRFLDEITVGNTQLEQYLQRVAGYCATGDTRDHALFFNFGEGSNAKNTFIEALQHAFGDYAKTISTETLMESRGDRHPTELANLMGVRLAISNEVAEGQHWAETRLKSLTGDETISARFMRQDFFEFRKTHKHVVIGNHKPALRTVDEAIRRRLHLIPWNAKFDEERRDRDMSKKLLAEAGSILAWVIRGCALWLDEGLNPPEIVRSTTAEYLSAQDTFSQWLVECTVTGNDESERSRRLYTSFRLWKQDRGERAPSEVRFASLLERRFEREHTREGTVFFGIGLTACEASRVNAEMAK